MDQSELLSHSATLVSCFCDKVTLPQVGFSVEQLTSVEIFDGSHVHSISIASS